MKNSRHLPFVLSMILVFGLAACGQDEETSTPPEEEGMAMEEAPAEEESQAMEEMPLAEPEEAMDESAVEEEEYEMEVYFISPEDGDEVTSPVLIQFGIEGMEVAPAGTQEPGTGHHHLLVNVDEMPDLSQPIPADENHIHFGKGQTEVELELEPGEHTLQLLFADGNHIPHDPPLMSEPITITVIEQAVEE